jgi:hypothetical protein
MGAVGRKNWTENAAHEAEKNARDATLRAGAAAARTRARTHAPAAGRPMLPVTLLCARLESAMKMESV